MAKRTLQNGSMLYFGNIFWCSPRVSASTRSARVSDPAETADRRSPILRVPACIAKRENKIAYRFAKVPGLHGYHATRVVEVVVFVVLSMTGRGCLP